MSIHIGAKKGEIAKTVIMPGDPLRAEKIAKDYLDGAVLVTKVRGMLGYTGKYKGKEITVMGSGMGIPSMGIYSYELYTEYGVETIIRVGSMGSNDKNLKLRDILLVDNSYTESEFAKNLLGEDLGEQNYISKGDKNLTDKIYEVGKSIASETFKRGNIACSECFDKYTKDPQAYYRRMKPEYAVLGCEMESFALFKTAEYLDKKAACLLTVVDSNHTEEALTSEEREKDLNTMIEIALNTLDKI